MVFLSLLITHTFPPAEPGTIVMNSTLSRRLTSDVEALTARLVQQTALDVKDTEHQMDLENLRHRFSTLPESTAACVDFKTGDFIKLERELLADMDAPDLVASLLKYDEKRRPPLLVRDDLQYIFDQLRKPGSTDDLVMEGVAGAGKTVNLVAVTQEYRRAGCLVVYVKAQAFCGSFVSRRDDAAAQWIRTFLRTPVTRFVLSQLPCSFSPQHSLLTLLRLGEPFTLNAFKLVLCLLDELRYVTARRVLVCIDQYNALLAPEQLDSNPLARLLRPCNDYRLHNGSVLYAYSSVGMVDTLPPDSRRAAERLQPNNFHPNELNALLERWIGCGAIPISGPSTAEYVQRVAEETHGLPREVGLLCLKYAEWFENRRYLHEYTDQAFTYFRARLGHVLSTHGRFQEPSVPSILFAASLYMGAPITHIPDSWQAAGLLSKDDTNRCRLSCPASYLAFYDIFNGYVSDAQWVPFLQGLKFLRADPDPVVRRRAVELAIINQLRRASTPVIVPSINIAATSSSSSTEVDDLVFSVERVVTLNHSREKERHPLAPGDVLVLWQNHVLRIFVYSKERRKIWFDISTEAYFDHAGLFESNLIGDASIYEFCRQCVDSNNRGNGRHRLEPDEFFVFLTTSDQKALQPVADNGDNVRVVSLRLFELFFGRNAAACFKN